MRYARKKGMTLLEVIISIAILGIIITPMLSLTLTSKKTNAKSEDNIQAMALAQKYFENLNSDQYRIDGDIDTNELINGTFYVKQETEVIKDISTSDSEISINDIPTENNIRLIITKKQKNGKYNYLVYQYDGNNYSLKQSYKKKAISIRCGDGYISLHNNGHRIYIDDNYYILFTIENISRNEVSNVTCDWKFEEYEYDEASEILTLLITPENIEGYSSDSSNSTTLYKIMVTVKDIDGKDIVTLEGFKLQQ